MTVFRQLAARRGVVIAAIGPAKWKTGFQSTWVGSAYFWFFAATLAAARWEVVGSGVRASVRGSMVSMCARRCSVGVILAARPGDEEEGDGEDDGNDLAEAQRVALHRCPHW